MVKLVETWGSDEQIAKIASLSYGKEEPKNVEKLLEKLVKCGHMSVLEFAGATFYVETSIIDTNVNGWRHRHFKLSRAEFKIC